nr:uncharacterized protein LOC108020344 isoform X2 [Drosophila suzukii]
MFLATVDVFVTLPILEKRCGREKCTTQMEPTPPVEPGPSQDSSFLDSKLKAMINSPLADAVILLSLKHATHYNIGRYLGIT